MLRIEGGHLEKVRCVDMVPDAHVKIHFLPEFSFQTVPGSFTEFQSAAWEFCIIIPADELVAYQHLFIFSQQYSVYANVEHFLIDQV